MRTLAILGFVLSLASAAIAAPQSPADKQQLSPQHGDFTKAMLDSKHDAQLESGYQCIPDCAERWADGSCESYGSDFCGINPSCAVNCSERWADGSCESYGSDFCSENRWDSDPVVCAVNCTERWADGSCESYGSDFCGVDASCNPRCAERWPDGSCETWGPDACWARPQR